MNEVICPCCDSYCEVSAEKLKELQEKQRTPKRVSPHEILCPQCWHVFLKVLKRFL